MDEVRLYINNQLIEFNKTPDILFTYQEDDLTNPTVVKNSYTKSITISGTRNNNIIFDGIWNVERIQTEENFNVTKRVPFALYINNDIYQSGYAKLDKISKVNDKIEYSITLYGGLGQFLYNLSIDWNTGDKKTLADMDYFDNTYSTTPVDLGFTINKDTVASAWTQITSNDKWGMVNFAPTYIGHPDKISCDKVLINFSGATIVNAITSGDTAYTPTGGYALGTLPQALSSEEVRDYRSYIQTPVIRVKSIFDAICRKENNAGRYDNGYDVELDSDFFSPSNPYYWDSWVTLPTITNLEFSSEGGGGTTTAYTANPISSEWDINGNCLYTFALNETVTAGSLSVKATIALGVTGSTNSNNLYFYYSHRYGRGQIAYRRNGYGIQLYASNSISSAESVLAGSNVKWLSGSQKYTYGDAVASGQFTPKWNTNVVENHTGYFTKVSGSTFQYTGETGNLLELSCDLPVGTSYFKLFIKRCNSSNSSERNMLFTSTSPNSGEKVQVTPLPFYSRDIVLSSIDSGESISNRYISKEMLLSTSYSPCDWLLSYCKKFGLYLKKDVVEDKIYIMTRNNYYKRDEVIDIDKDIDYSKSFDINPVYCQNGYLSLTDEGIESKSYADYVQKTGKVYGQKVVNTGYEFNADVKELNDKGVFKGSIQAKDVSQYLNKRSSLGLLPYMYNGFKYNLYANGDYTGSTYEITYPQDEITNVCEPFDENFPNYDLIGKPMFTDDDGKSLDTENVLLFFNGYENVSQYKWYLTDDHSYMYKLNNNPTWWMTFSEYDSFGSRIANQIINFPRFSRWLEGNRWMIYSLDYGSPRFLYVPDFQNNDSGNVYYNYFKRYYEDLYDVDTKVVDCYALGKFDEESLRKFYWFRNCIWRLNKVTDYSPINHDTTKVQFVKVQNLDNMTNDDATNELWIKVELDKYFLPISGGTLIGTVTTSDNYGWNIEYVSFLPTGDTAYTVTIDPQSWGSSGNFYLTANTNLLQDKKVTIHVTAGDVGGSVTYIQEGLIDSFGFDPSEVVISSYGDIIPVTIINPVEYEWEIVGYPDWVDWKKSTSGGSEIIYIKAGENTGDHREGSIVVWTKENNKTHVLPIVQLTHDPYLYVSPSDEWFEHSGGTNEVDVDANIIWNAITTGGTPVTGLTFNAYWTTDIPASGGVATSANCNVSVVARYYDGTNVNVTTAATITGYLNVNPSIITTRHSVDVMELTASYEGLTAKTNILVYQEAHVPHLTGITISNLIYNGGDIPASGGVASYSSCTYTVTANYENSLDDKVVTNSASTSGYLDVPSSTVEERHSAGTLTVTATYSGLTDSADVVIYQQAYTVHDTGITLTINSVPDVPSSGGTVSASNCTYTVILYNSEGEGTDVTTAATVVGSVTIPASTVENRHSAGTLTLTAAYNGLTDTTYATIYQSAYVVPLTAITIENLAWVNDVAWSGGIATSANTSFDVIGYFENSTTANVTSNSTISGSLAVATSSDIARHSAGTLTLTAEYSGFTASGSTVAYQEGVPVSSITIENLVWVYNIPASGGTADSGNCTFVVEAHYANGSTGDVTTSATISGSVVVPSSIVETTHSAGTLTLTASYSGFTASGNTVIYQDAYGNPGTKPITFEIISGGTIIWYTTDNSVAKTIEYSKDNGATWSSITSTESGSSISVNEGDNVMFRGDNTAYCVGIEHSSFSASSGTRFNAKGNIMSLVDSDDFTGVTSVSDYAFYAIFMDCTALADAGELYLPATTLGNSCYCYMFYGCSSLTTAPALPATTLANYCYRNMFEACTSLTTAPVLPAQLLVTSCYEYMFAGCSNLNYIKCLAVEREGSRITNDWVRGVQTNSGTFVKDSTKLWGTGNSGIPNNWTIIDNT